MFNWATPSVELFFSEEGAFPLFSAQRCALVEGKQKKRIPYKVYSHDVARFKFSQTNEFQAYLQPVIYDSSGVPVFFTKPTPMARSGQQKASLTDI